MPGVAGAGALSWIAPIMCFSIVVGLGLDYDVFLICRVMEYRKLGGSYLPAASSLRARSHSMCEVRVHVAACAASLSDSNPKSIIRILGECCGVVGTRHGAAHGCDHVELCWSGRCIAVVAGNVLWTATRPALSLVRPMTVWISAIAPQTPPVPFVTVLSI